jgi:hypothetical protein
MTTIMPQPFSQHHEVSEKSFLSGNGEKIENGHKNKEFKTSPKIQPGGTGKYVPEGEKITVGNYLSSNSVSSPMVTISASPDAPHANILKSVLHDCEQLSATALRGKYPREYNSWKNRKSRCAKLGYKWAQPWNDFRQFLRDMGPAKPGETLDRIDNELKEYGPGLCRWASSAVQNNNKGDNVKIVIPLTGEVFTPQKLANLHNVTPKTVYKWVAGNWSPYELLAGKKSDALRAEYIAADELKSKLPPVPPKGVKPPVHKIPTLPFPSEESCLAQMHKLGMDIHDEDEVKAFMSQIDAEYATLGEWVKRHNLGYDEPQPKLQHLKFKPSVPPAPHVLPSQSALNLEDAAYDDDDDDDDDGYDPADCAPPDYEGEDFTGEEQ